MRRATYRATPLEATHSLSSHAVWSVSDSSPVLSLCWVLAAASPFTARYLMSLEGVPVGVVELRLEGSTYRYTSTHAYRSGARVRQATFDVGASGAAPPEALYLAQRPPPGCKEVVEELTRAAHTVCVGEEDDRGRVDGRIGASPFSARYDESGRLQRLEVAGATFVASTKRGPSRADPFSEGFSVVGKGPGLELSPPEAGLRAVVPRAVGDEGTVPPERSCLELARKFALRDPRYTVVVGLAVEGDRAWPHAWLNHPAGPVDPSVSPRSEVVRQRRYLEFPSGRAGELYLELLSGARRVIRTPSLRR